jgi:hypothetical protein
MTMPQRPRLRRTMPPASAASAFERGERCETEVARIVGGLPIVPSLIALPFCYLFSSLIVSVYTRGELGAWDPIPSG